MATNATHNDLHNGTASQATGTNGVTHNDFEKATSGMNNEERHRATMAGRFGYGPLAHMRTNDTSLLPAFGGEFQPGRYKAVADRKIANPAPLGLSAFALTTFVLSLINIGARDVTEPNIVVALAFGYGGLVQLLAGMWEMAVGNTFGATALSSYGGFWIAFGIVLTPGGFEIVSSLEAADGGSGAVFYNSFSFFLWGWFIFTTILLLCTLRSTVAFFMLFFTLDLTFLMLAIAYMHQDGAGGSPNKSLTVAGGAFGVVAALLAWYNALAGIADDSNSFFVIPVVHFPWSDVGRSRRNNNSGDDYNPE